jgi:hypothetical protein
VRVLLSTPTSGHLGLPPLRLCFQQCSLMRCCSIHEDSLTYMGPTPPNLTCQWTNVTFHQRIGGCSLTSCFERHTERRCLLFFFPGRSLLHFEPESARAMASSEVHHATTGPLRSPNRHELRVHHCHRAAQLSCAVHRAT